MFSLVQVTGVDPYRAHARPRHFAVARIPVAALLAVVVALPFEVPLRTTVFALTVTTVEAVIAVAVLVALGAIAYGRTQIRWRTPLSAAVLACVAAAFVSALLSPVDLGNAMRFAGRMLAAAVVAAVVLNIVVTKTIARVLVTTLVIVAAAVAVVAILEAVQVAWVTSALTVFRPGFHVVGGQLRATSTLLYPTVTSMYLEVAFALGLWLVLEPRANATRGERVVVWLLLATIAGGIVATFTRAGLLAMAGALALAAAMQYAKLRRIDRTHARLAALAAAIVVFVLASRSPDVLLARLTLEGSQEWYGANYAAPPSLSFTTGGEYRVPIGIENTGHVVWDSSTIPMFAVSYHWLRADTEAVVDFEGWRTPFAAPVPPGTHVTIPVDVRAPGMPGRYVLVWDVVHEHRAWLSTEGVPPARTLVDVIGPPVAATSTSMRQLPAANSRADRLTLWRAALEIAAAHTLFGIGPDNFRTVYGRYIDQPAFDARVHTNNMYLEALVGGGVFGFGALVWLMFASAIMLGKQWQRASIATAPASVALAATWLVIAGHGMVDSFLSFTATYATFAIAAGLAVSPGITDADRV